ncbi:toxin-antitoxin system YwqK family antitoxin [Marivirga sp. S37H4]|uniref:Toxin-antitoxin system YwqK family antitoxin n=1 Tax=Marivirga aurantiaca TaxID=2802615 RepID=A0A934WX05_9BACT|nr:toxin-antitoxin system YwqK family antitoxin [Marivirga aurantiaca]MBK6264668.1 toxin-antitoxin system YwqK family antitoxin [Marivirga aurantiaca]
MRIIFWAILYLSSLHLHAQSKEVRVYYDDEREHLQERYFVKDMDHSVLYGDYESYYISGQLKSKGKYENNESFGQWKYFYENGSLKMKGQLKDNSNHGFWSYYYENGKLRMEGNIYEGKREGEWVYYFETGVIKSEGAYLNDIKNGLWSYYYEDGTLKGQAIYDLGNGLYKEFYPDGALKLEGFIRNEKSDSLWKSYYETGELKSKGHYLEGAKDGKWTYYFKDGNVSGEGDFIDNLSHGKWVYYYENGAVKAEGAERAGKREGYWKLYYNDGVLKGEGVYEAGSGSYKEFYESGKLKLKGQVLEGKNHGPWTYYYETGELEGKINYEEGVGEYSGFYKDGTLKMTGEIEEGVKRGTWELYDEKGQLVGYYKPIYEEYEPILRQAKSKSDSNTAGTKYNKPEYRFKSKSGSYFQSRNNDFPTVILQANPFNMIFGDLQVSVEYNIQQRIGYELLVHTFRNPFFANSFNLRAGDDFFNGYGFSFRQRFYHKDSKFGVPYFGHSVSYTNVNHLKLYESSNNGSEIKAQIQAQGVRYGLLVGSRILQNLNDSGFTFDINAGINFNYYFYGNENNTADQPNIFEELKNKKFILQPIVGLSFGYVFRIKKVSTLNP